MSDDTETIVIDIIKPNSKPFAVVVETYLLGDLNCDLLSERSRRPITLLNSFLNYFSLNNLSKSPLGVMKIAKP